MRQNRFGTSRLWRARRVRVAANLVAVSALAILTGLGVAARGDEFGGLEGAYLFDLSRRPDARRHTSLSLRELEALPVVLRGESAAFVIAQTDQGNLAKMLVSLGMRKRKPSEQQGQLVPVLILERYETIDAGDHQSIKARGKELMLFDGFQFDLDTGQVVPAGLGGDILFSTRGPDGPKLTAVDKDHLYVFDKPLPAPPSAPGRPSTGRIVQPADYAGRYHLIANGQWSGTLDLTVDAAGTVSGRFLSDLNGSVYAVTGQVAVEAPEKLRLMSNSLKHGKVTRGYSGPRAKTRSPVRFPCSIAPTVLWRSARGPRSRRTRSTWRGRPILGQVKPSNPHCDPGCRD